MSSVKTKRAYVAAEKQDGLRVLVDRVWPRGISKTELQVDVWLRDVAPSTALRKWFGHDPDRWDEFKRRYFEELRDNPEAVKVLRDKMRHGTVTLVYGAKDEEHNQAVALKAFLQHRSK